MVRVYVEGGGKGPALRTKCREAFNKLISRAGLQGRMPRIVACGSRKEAFDDFCTAQRHAGPDDFICLLVDSEDSVPDGTPAWIFLANRLPDKWEQPPNAIDENAHLMVQCMEAWLLADPAALERFYGNGFRRNAIPNRADVEKIPKRDIFTALENATRGCTQKGEYSKGRHSFDILATLDPALVERASPYSRRFFETLRQRA